MKTLRSLTALLLLPVLALFSACTSPGSGAGAPGTAGVLASAAVTLAAGKALDRAATPEKRAHLAERLSDLAAALDTAASGKITREELDALLRRYLPAGEPAWALLGSVLASYLPPDGISLPSDPRLTAAARAIATGLRAALPSGK